MSDKIISQFLTDWAKKECLFNVHTITFATDESFVNGFMVTIHFLNKDVFQFDGKFSDDWEWAELKHKIFYLVHTL